jgi:hypothetical protein
MRNLRSTGDLKAMPPGGPRGRSRANKGLKRREMNKRSGIEIKAAMTRRGLSNPKLIAAPESVRG